ncbi:MAG: hemin uptake protein HemP [Reyranella sp.]|jgi:hemin uptake protein HemP|nr:hemin uptake protein HemP [Reyranella sp.]
MNQITRPIRANQADRDRPEASTSALDTPTVESVALMSGRRELIIRHNADTYRLRVTASNKLILTK